MAIDVETYGDGFMERVATNVVSEEEDVRDVLTKVALGEVATMFLTRPRPA